MRIYYCECTCAPDQPFADGHLPHFYPANKEREAIKKFRHYEAVRDQHFGDPEHFRPTCKCALFWAVHLNNRHILSVVPG